MKMMSRQWNKEEINTLRKAYYETIKGSDIHLSAKPKEFVVDNIYQAFRAKGLLRSREAINQRLYDEKLSVRRDLSPGINKEKNNTQQNDNEDLQIQDSKYLMKLKRYKYLYHYEMLKNTFKHKHLDEINWKMIAKLNEILSDSAREIAKFDDKE